MRVLTVIDSVSPTGAERSLLALAPRYVAAGIAMEVVYLRDREGLQEDFRRIGVPVRWVGSDGSRIDWIRRLTAKLHAERPDLVHTTLFESDIAGRVATRIAGVPVVSTLANESYGPAHVGHARFQWWKVRSAQALDVVTARATRRIHSVATWVADVMAERLRYPRDRIDVVPRGRDPDALGRRTVERSAGARATLEVAADTPVVLAVARHNRKKGLDLLVEALPAVRLSVPEVRVFVAGARGAESEDLEQEISRRSLDRVMTLLGPRADVPDLLTAADVFAMPSRAEGSPGSLVEALALEAPAVVSDIPQMLEVVDDATARVVPLDSVEALAAAIVETLQDRAAARERAARGRELFLRRFTTEATSVQMIEFYERALRSPRPSRAVEE